jgi:hypothetical protein
VVQLSTEQVQTLNVAVMEIVIQGQNVLQLVILNSVSGRIPIQQTKISNLQLEVLKKSISQYMIMVLT